jgi:hypothetical protein
MMQVEVVNDGSVTILLDSWKHLKQQAWSRPVVRLLHAVKPDPP